MSNIKDNALVFYSRLPTEDLKAKTRLAKEIGNQTFASELARCLILDLLEEYSKFSGERYDLIFYYKGNLGKFKEKKQYNVTKYVKQLRGELSINHIHKKMSERYNKILIVGSDIPLISNKTILNCFSKLDTHDGVIIPTEDGGYGLIGTNGYHDLYTKITNWDSRTKNYHLLKETKKQAESQKLDIHIAPETFDIDSLQDIKRMMSKIAINNTLQPQYKYLKRSFEILKNP